jgi:NADH-quinone oxidoreductase subunit M
MSIGSDLISLLPIDVLPALLLIPLIACPIAYALGKVNKRAPLIFTVIVTAFLFFLSLAVVSAIDRSSSAVQFKSEVEWVPQFGMTFLLGVDTLSAVMVVLATFVVLTATIASTPAQVYGDEGSYFAFVLLMETGLLGVFVAFDLMVLFVFWELVLIPMFFLIGRWGEEGKTYAAVKFFIYTHFGSAVMFIGFLYMYVIMGTFNMLELRDMFSTRTQILLVLGIFMGAGAKLPIFPLHNWLPDAHVRAPSPMSMVLAGILLKMGGYLFIRGGPWLLPRGWYEMRFIFAGVAIFTLFYAALTAMAQVDFKRMVAYTSINHMSFVLLGVAVSTEFGISGAIFQMFSHGVIISILFCLAGLMGHSMTGGYGTREIPKLNGMLTRTPRLAILLIIASFAGFGLPGFSGFIAEALVVFGAVPVIWWTALAVGGVVITAAYFVWILNRIAFSDPVGEEVKDITRLEIVSPVLLLIPAILLGLYPELLLDLVGELVRQISATVV